MENFINPVADFLLAIYPAFYILAHFCGLVFVASGFTDLFFDLYFIAYSIRRFIVGRKWQPLTLERMEAREQQRIAIFIAAWKEADVIANTLTHACEAIRYRNYDIFVGTYPNDAATQSEVDKVAEKYERIHKVVVPENGPTNKASNLNHVFNALQKYESQTQQYFDIIVIHDSEDIIHPYSLLVYNYLIPRMDMIQIPVFPVALPLSKVTHWTYADEFAENHTKILRVRELAGGFVPSAGVGTAFTKRSFQRLALQNSQEIFPTNTVTEDYQLGLKLNLNQIKTAFVQVQIKDPDTPAGQKSPYLEWVATQAVFPTDIKRAIRQKTRWNIGIIFQGWKNIGWRGSLAVKWNLLQDRKALIAAPVNFLAYLVFLYFLLYAGIANLTSKSMPAVILQGSLLWYLMIISAAFMVWRALNRAYAVNKIYGWLPALTSIPRIIWGNLINFLAIVRALYYYLSSRLKHRQVAWDKTTHEFPLEISAERKTAPLHPSNSDQNIEKLYSGKTRDEIIKAFQCEIGEANHQKRIQLLLSIPRAYGELLFPYFISYINDPSWEVRAAVCRTLSFLRFPQALPYLEQAACDSDWIVRGNAVRAIGKLGDEGEEALLRLLQGHDRYAREAALAVLEQQGFYQHHLEQIKRTDGQDYDKSLRFFEILADAGGSKLAKEVLAENKKRVKQQKSKKLRLLLKKKNEPPIIFDQHPIEKDKLLLFLQKKKQPSKITEQSLKKTSKKNLFIQKITPIKNQRGEKVDDDKI